MRHGSNIDPPNRFETVRHEPDFEHLEWDQEHLHAMSHRKIEYLADSSKSILSENKSPDIPFRYSLNPYRGCVHACSYCYARPGHEYLGFNAGLDFETKIVVKHDAPRLLRELLSKDSWQPESITFSGVTDCYQPAEREFRLTRQCLEVAADFHQPVGIITKNALVVRDLDVLTKLAAENLVHVFVSITSLDPQLARDMEPRTSIPSARLRAVGMLADAGIPVGVMTAPIIPGLNDTEIPQLLMKAGEAGARCAAYTILRLPLAVAPVFEEWLRRCRPSEADKVLSRIKQMRSGKLNDSRFGARMKGQGFWADQISKTFRLFAQRYGLAERLEQLDSSRFRRPLPTEGQLRLFE